MIFQFSKLQSLGNDFILIDESSQDFFFTPNQIQKLCHRHYGIGSDGLILFKKLEPSVVKMRFYNPDGSQAKMCGNGLRCLFLHTDAKVIETDSGEYKGQVEGELVITWMKTPQFKGRHQLLIDETIVNFDWIDSGVDHIVIKAEDHEFKSPFQIAQKLRSHPYFGKEGVNVNFFSESPKFHLKTFERGVENFTLACGTGALACFSTLNINKAQLFFDEDNFCDFSSKENTIAMKAFAKRVFQGTFEKELLDF